MTFKLGEIIGYRYWVVSWGNNLFGPHSWHHWHPTEPTSGSIKRDGAAGVYALKTSEQVEKVISDPRLRKELAHWWLSEGLLPPKDLYPNAPAIAIGSVKLWGTVWEHQNGYRAEFGRIRTIDKVLVGHEFEQEPIDDTIINQIRALYGA